MARTHSPATRHSALLAAIVAAAALLPTIACVDVRGFAGSWEGALSAEEALLQGFASDVTIRPLQVEDITLTTVRATLSTDDGSFSSTALQPIDRVTGDSLSSMTFDGNPLRSYMLFADLASESSSDPAWLVLSLFADDRIELRIMRRNNLYGVFQLRRQE